MSKNISRFLALTAILAVLTSGAFQSSPRLTLRAQQRPAISSHAAREAAIVEATANVLEETSKIRELPILQPVKSGAQSRAQIENMLVKNLYEQMTTAEMHATEVAYRKFGLGPATFEYRPFIIKLLLEQIAGYYDPVTREFYLADWLELETQKPVMAHELTHALQDQHFNLRRFQKWPHGDSDAQLAAHSLIEGDATLAMMVYMAKNPLVALAFTRSLNTGVSTEQFNQAPRALRESLIFPYLQGSQWATSVYKRDGFAGLSKAFTNLPLSTEQILHPEKYFANERPLKITLPDVSSLLNKATASNGSSSVSLQSPLSTQYSALSTQHPAVSTSPSWHRIDSDVNGEWGYYLLLDQFLNSPAESRRAAAGWAGDRYDVYEGAESGQAMIAQISTWDTEADAREFFEAYVKRSKLRYPDAKDVAQINSEDQTRNSKSETRNFYSWQTNEGQVVMELRGLRVTIVEGLSQQVDASNLLKVLRS